LPNPIAFGKREFGKNENPARNLQSSTEFEPGEFTK
jgi:hypothetical protein